ncbi:MAG TPA: M48 family metallopeptidase [Gammaproteobacteria bacterium]|nr:M48 family metallopeptidase [Gammaproteobacteria bacterium]
MDKLQLKRRGGRLLLGALVLTLLGGCATVPETGRSQLILVSREQTVQLSLSEFDKLKKDTPISKDAQATALVKRVGRRIAAVAPLPNAKWEFVLFDKPDVANAFCLPGGKVGVYSGILKITQDEAGLATVIAHEVGHAVARHGAERISEGLLVKLGGTVLEQAMQSRPAETQSLVLGAYGIGSQLGVMLPHSRQQELEADHLGLIYMARAGYDPREALAFWKRFAAYNKKNGGAPPEFLSTHPLDARRIKQIEKLLPDAEAEYRKAKR